MKYVFLVCAVLAIALSLAFADHEAPADGVIQIFVKTLTGLTIPFEVYRSDTIKDLMVKFEKKEGVPVDKQRFVRDGVTLADGHTLAYYNIHNNSTIYFLLRIRSDNLEFYKRPT